MLISDVALKNRITVLVLFVLILVVGIGAYRALPREAFPDIPVPHIFITTIYEGVAPEDIESAVTMKIEKQLTGVSGVKEIRSSSAEGMSLIDVEFTPDVPTDTALQRVRDRVDLARGDLPIDVRQPIIREMNLAEMPIMFVSIAGGASPVQLKEIADTMRDDLEALPGVLKVDILGALEREIRLEIDPDRLAAYNLTMAEILALIPSEHVNISAGGLATAGTKFNIRIPAEFHRPEELPGLLLATRNGRPIYVSDVATVRDTFKDRTSFSRLNGVENITLSIQKRSGSNNIAVSDAVKGAIARASQQWPQVTFDITFDMAKFVRSMLSDLQNHMAAALILVVAVLVLTMGWGPSMIVSIVIPLSLLITFFLIRSLGYTLNMIVLFSLILVLGRLVDDAIVIVENIYRHRQMGHGRVEAALLGAREVAWPVTTSTLATVAAFLPLMFWPGLMGSFMKYLPITLSLALLSSLFVALVFNPAISSVFAGRHVEPRQMDHWFIRGYRRFQQAGLNHPATTILLSGLLLVGLGILYAKLARGVEFFPQGDPERVVINIRTAQGTNIHETDRIAREIERRLKPFEKEIKQAITSVGAAGGQVIDLTAATGGPHLANITLVFHDFEERVRPSLEVMAEIRRAVADIPGAEIQVDRQKDGPPTGAPVTVRLTGKDFKALEEISADARRQMAGVPGLVNLRSDLESARPELAFTVDRRRAALLGVNTAAVGNFLKMAVFGAKVGIYRQYNDEYDITVRLPVALRANTRGANEQIASLDDLMRLQVPNAMGQPVPLSSLGQFDYRGGLGTINRVNQKRAVTLTADAEGRQEDEVLRDVQTRMTRLNRPAGYEISYVGQKQEEEESKAFMSNAFVIALLLIAMILVVQFNSLTIPFIIMSTVVLSLIGALVGLIVCGLPFVIIMTGLGFFSLAGVVVTNAIVLLYYTRQLQDRGLDVSSAAAEAGVTRLRPVLLTASTTVIGLIPTAIGVSYNFQTWSWTTRSESSQMWSNIAIVVIFGLTFATILTLVVVPSLYVMLYRLTARLGFGGITATKGDGRKQ